MTSPRTRFARHRTLLAGACAAALLGVTGCSGGSPSDDPTPIMPTSTSPTTEPTPTGPVEPTPPPELEGDNAAAAEAFVRYFYDWVNYAQVTGDVKGLQEQSLPSCTTCTAGSEGLEKIYDRGGSISGGGIRVLKAKATGSRSVTSEITIWYLDVRFHGAKQTVSGAGDLDGTYPAGEVNLRFRVIRDQKAWHVDSWSVKP